MAILTAVIDGPQYDFTTIFSPNGDLIVGTIETLWAKARISGIDPETLEPPYEGGTDVNWDSKQTVTLWGKVDIWL